MGLSGNLASDNTVVRSIYDQAWDVSSQGIGTKPIRSLIVDPETSTFTWSFTSLPQTSSLRVLVLARP
jgi:hypothetical protein